MKKHKTYTVGFRRKREGKTDYRKRIKLLRSGKTRLVVRPSLHYIRAQLIQYKEKGDKVAISICSSSLKKLGWGFSCANTSSGYLLGLLIGKQALAQGIKEVILDIGLRNPVPGSKMYAVLKGALDSGLNIPHSPKILPSEERIKGIHIETFAKKIKEQPSLFEKSFSGYIKKGVDPLQISKNFEETKNKILGV